MTRKIEEIAKELAREMEISYLTVESAIRHQFGFVKRKMEDNDLNSIKVHGLGTFEVKLERLNSLIRNLIKSFRKNPDIYSSTAKADLARLWEIRNKKLKERLEYTKRNEHFTRIQSSNRPLRGRQRG
jgi:nucleoid DNA-binding protein